MKTLAIVLSIALAGALVFIYVNSQSGYDTLKQENKALKEHVRIIRHEKDSAIHALELTKDSIDVAYELLKLAKNETLEANKVSQMYQKKYDRLVFVTHRTNQERDSVLKKLYPSYENGK